MNKKISNIINIFQNKSHLLNYRTIAKIYNLENKEHVTSSNINSILSRDIRLNGKKSIFFRAAPGVYGLRSWMSEKGNQYSEYLVTRKRHDYLKETIAVIKYNDLNKLIQSPGVTVKPINNDLLSRLCIQLDRKKAEISLEYIQLVSVFVLIYNKKVLSFTRTNSLPEKRLRSTISINFGGHISYNDAYSAVYRPFDILDSNSLISRELYEEVSIKNNYKIKPVGYIYDDSSALGRQHLGLLHLVELSSNKVEVSEKKFFINLAFSKIEKIIMEYKLDYWSISILEYIKNYFNEKNKR